MSKIRTTHTAVRTGKKVRIQTAGGDTIIGKFFDRDSRHVFLDTDGGRIRIRRSEIKRFSSFINKPNQ